MPSCYILKVCADFASAHSLRDYPGDCRRLHGHNWKVEVEVTAHVLNAIGIAIDFKDVKSAARDVAKRLDHHYLNDIAPFDRINPTAENLSAYFYRELST
ncbi:MAG: 6-carboxytetrahydropterin synthase QueD, partial [Gammaproteobacteria bacterium]|nr:6-carboxytetrahydropterin synthase QueD [Gammaproteobacteria bacterium]